MLRFAPSPTRDMHIGDLRVAIINYLAAKQRNEPFLVRMNDTDKDQVIEGKDTEIMQILGKFAIIHDQVYHQSEHLRMHQTLAIRLLEEGKAFICTCTPEQIEAEKKEAEKNNLPYCYSGHCLELDSDSYTKLKESGEPFVIRIKKPQEDIAFTDILKGDITFTSDEVDSFVILNQDATPTADFASACDDMLSGITLVIDEEAHLLQTARQLHVKQMLGYAEETHYAHLSPVVNKKGELLSAENEGSLKTLFEEGFVPDAIINYLLLLENPNAPKEIFYFPEALEWFKLEEIPRSSVTFDMEKLRLINREHLKMMDDKRLSGLFGFADADIGKLAKVYLEEFSTVKELEAKVKPIFAPKPFESALEEPMQIIQQVLIDAPMFATFDELKSYVVKETGLDEKALEKPLRVLLTGAEDSVPLSNIYPYIKSYLLEVIS